MKDVLNKYITIAIEIVLFSLIIAIIALFSGVAKYALNNKTESNAIMGELTEFRKVYKYIELADSNTQITGDDIVQFVADFKRKYDIEIDGVILYRTDLNNKTWELEGILDVLKETMTSKYNIKYIKNTGTELIEKFIFTKLN